MEALENLIKIKKQESQDRSVEYREGLEVGIDIGYRNATDTVKNPKLYNADFKKYYDTTQKRNIWVLGYFGGGSVNVMNAYQVAADYSNATGVPIGSVQIDEILSSRRFKGFKIVYSTAIQAPENDTTIMANDVYAWLRD